MPIGGRRDAGRRAERNDLGILVHQAPDLAGCRIDQGTVRRPRRLERIKILALDPDLAVDDEAHRAVMREMVCELAVGGETRRVQLGRLHEISRWRGRRGERRPIERGHVRDHDLRAVDDVSDALAVVREAGLAMLALARSQHADLPGDEIEQMDGVAPRRRVRKAHP